MKLKKKDLKIVGEVSHSGKIVDPKGLSSTVLGQRMNTVPHIIMRSDSSTSSAESEASDEALNSAEDIDASGPATTTSTPTKSIQPDFCKPTTIQVTLGESIQRRYPTSISFVQDFHAKRFRLRARGRVSKTLVERFSSRYSELRKLKDLHCYSSKTLKASLTMTEEELSRSSFNRWMSWGTGSNGRFLTANTSESPRTGNGCSLSDILETEVPSRYFLSQKQTEWLTRALQKKGNTARLSTQTITRESTNTDNGRES